MMIVITVDIMMIRWKDAAFTVHVGVSGRDSVVSHAIVMMVLVMVMVMDVMVIEIIVWWEAFSSLIAFSKVTLECGAHNIGYCKPDIESSCPQGECCVDGADEEASTCLNMEEMLEQVLNLHPKNFKL